MILFSTIVCMAEPGTNQPGGGVTIRYHKSTFLQVWAYNVTNNTNMHHGNQSGRARGYNFSLRKTEEAKYPFILCQRVAFILKQEAAARGFHFPEDLQQQVQVDDNVGKRQLLLLNHVLVNSNHWYLNSWDTRHWFAACHYQISWTKCQKEPEFVIAKLNGGFVGPMQTRYFPAVNVHQAGRTTQFVKSFMWASQGHQRTSHEKRFPRDTRET